MRGVTEGVLNINLESLSLSLDHQSCILHTPALVFKVSMASLKRSKTLPADGQTTKFLYTILKQLDLKSVSSITFPLPPPESLPERSTY